jgi:4-amino-4-deoxy-L-arabinose transferase-like glycosyltransferase
MSAVSAASPGAAPAVRQRRLPGWWPLAALTLLAAVLRLATLNLQSFWYDEAFTPVHVLQPGLEATLRGVVHTENTPPLWYLLAWVFARLFGDGEVALRLPSALAGIAAVPVVWAIGERLAGRRAALVAAALIAVGPLFVWYSQEARAYSLFVLTAALAILTWLRALEQPSGRRLAAFAACGALALLSHYFAVFLLAPMAVMLAAAARARPPARRATAAALGALVLVGLALVPLVKAQGGHGAQWIERWPLAERLEAIPQYYLTGASGAPLGHGVELLLAVPFLGGLGLWLWRVLAVPPARRTPSAVRELRGITLMIVLAACGVLIPLVLVAFSSDYLAPRNLIGAMVPVTLALAIALGSPAAGRTGLALAVLAVAGLLAVTIDVDLSPRLQRGNWRGLARVLHAGPSDRAITTVELGAAPLEYYLPELRLGNLPRGATTTLSQIDETGYLPLRAGAGAPPTAGFQLTARSNVDGLIEYRFQAAPARAVGEATLRRHVITLAHPEVLVPHVVLSGLHSGAVQVVRQRKDLAFR